MTYQRGLLVLACAISGIVWGGLGAAVGASKSAFGGLVIGGVWLSPIIGLLVGLGSCAIYRKRFWFLIPWSLFTLYLGVALFGFGVGLYDALRPIPNRALGAVVLQAALASVYGITILHLVWLLWPLSWFNHVILRVIYNRQKRYENQRGVGLNCGTWGQTE